MTQPWVPMPNPGGSNREFIRKITAQWIFDAGILGVNNVYASPPPEELYDDGQPGSLYRCNVSVHVSDISDNFTVQTGPSDSGGYFAHYSVRISLKHLTMSSGGDDWQTGADDHDRILDAIKDRFRGEGRDMGRPDVVLQAAAWPSEGSIRSETGDPIYDDGVRSQWSSIFITVTQYMQRQP